MRIREVGDSALLLELAAGEAQASGVIDPDVNARAIAIARTVRGRAVPGVRDVTSTFSSVAVFFDPLATDVEGLVAALHNVEDDSLPPATGKLVEVPVMYGGAAGPDLDDVAAYAGCSPQSVIDRHAGTSYRVFMLGFLPGFAYMATVDQSIAVPRRSTPRVRVPVGSVGLAGRQTGIYPQESPGGWQIIGRAGLQLFDANRAAPTLFEPGDHVRFVPTSAIDVAAAVSPSSAVPRPDSATKLATRCATVLRPGLLTTVQDTGRWGYQGLGVPVSGPMDAVAHRLANAVIRNPPDAATLEATLLGPELRLEQDTWIALGGADLSATLDGAAVPLQEPLRCRMGSVLRFGERRSGVRVYVAFEGGIAVPRVLGSRSTHVLSGLGGVEGRAVRAGVRLPLGAPGGEPRRLRSDVGGDLEVCPAQGVRLRILPGPQIEFFDPSAFEKLQRTRFTISPQSDRMGYRLVGGSPPACAVTGQMISDATFAGGLQIPPDGDPILLMADRQATGGYPQLAIVITADLSRAAQLAPGDWVEFEACSRSDALSALITQEGKLLAVR